MRRHGERVASNAPETGRSVVRPRPASDPRLLVLQRTAGNRAVVVSLQRHMQPTMPEDVGLSQGAPGGPAAPQPATEEVVNPDGGTAAPAKKPPAEFDVLADQIREAVDGPGTDEDAVYAALRKVGSEPGRVAAFRLAYIQRTGHSLDADIRGDMEGEELARAKALIGGTREKRIRTEMARTEDGRWALDVLNKYKVEVDWEYKGTGSFQQGGKIFLNYRTPAKQAAPTMVHEAQHASTYKSGKDADAEKLDMATFVKRSIADECEAVVRANFAKLHMTVQGDAEGDVGANWMTKQIYDAYRAEWDKLTAAGVPVEERKQKAKDAVRDTLVLGWFNDGTFKTSTSGGSLTYPQHYEGEWKRINGVK